MSGFTRFRAPFFLVFLLALVQVPAPVSGQTAQERAREAELRQRIEALHASRQERLARLEEALMRAQEEVAQNREQTQQMRAEQLQEIEEAVARTRAQLQHSLQEQEELIARARAQAQHSEQMQEEVRARELRTRAEALRRVEERRARSEEEVQRTRERVRQVMDRVRDQERRARQVVVRMRGRIRLGVSFTGSQGEELDAQGVRLEEVIEDSPAEEAGLEEGDIITHLNGHALVEPLRDEDDQDFDEGLSLPAQRLSALAQELEAGDEIKVRYLRDGMPETVTFEAAEVERGDIRIFATGDEGLRRGVFRVRPGREGVLTLSSPGDEIIALRLSEFEDQKILEDLKIELKELEGLERLEDISIHLSELDELEDLKVRLGNLRVDAPNMRVWTHPEASYRALTLREGETPELFSILESSAGFGLDLAELNPGLAEYFSTESGLLVLDVEEDSTLGLRAGDVIQAIDGRAVESPADVRRILRSYEEGEAIAFSIVRNGQTVQVEGSIR